MLDYSNSSTVYLSQSKGNDHYSGFSAEASVGGAGPVRTMGRVFDMLWNMRACGVLQPVTVKIMGDYYLESPINVGFEYANAFFSREHEMKNVTFESFGVIRSRIIGGRRLTGFQRDVFNGVRCISLYLPEVKSGAWTFSDLYVNGKRADLTRYPKEGTLQAVTTENPTPESYQEGSRWFVAHKEDLFGIDVENTIVSYYHFWTDEHSSVESYDPETGRITMSLRSRFQLSADYERNATVDMHYYLENVSTTFSMPNEWFLDVKNGMLYYIPENPDAPIDELEIYAPTLERLVQVSGTAEHPVSGIRFRNLDFLCTKGDYSSNVRFMDDPDRDAPLDVGYAADEQALCDAYGAIGFSYAEDCFVSDCSVNCVGLHAIDVRHGCRNVRVENCRLENLGGGGIRICGGKAEESAEKETSYCVVRNNLIRNVGRRYAAACGILVMHASHNEISDNEVCYTDYTGISVGWVWGYKPSSCYANIIRNNHVHHVGMGELSDMGGIYLLGEQNGTVVEGNIVHDITSKHYGACGIYTDEGSAYITVEKNLVYNCKTCCYNHHFGQYVTVRDNIFAFTDQYTVTLGRDDAHMGLLLEGNTIITDQKPIYGFFGGDMTVLLSLKAVNNRILDVSGREPVMLCYRDGDECGEWTLSEWQRCVGRDEGTTVGISDDIVFDVKSRTVSRRSEKRSR